MDNTLECFIGVVVGVAFGALVGTLIGIDVGKKNTDEQVVKQCSTKGLYIIDGVAIQCPVVVKTKE